MNNYPFMGKQIVVATARERRKMCVREATPQYMDEYFFISVLNDTTVKMFQESNEQCSICCEEYEIGQKIATTPECLHTFHYDCLLKWLATKTKCPLDNQMIYVMKKWVKSSRSRTPQRPRSRSRSPSYSPGSPSYLPYSP